MRACFLLTLALCAGFGHAAFSTVSCEDLFNSLIDSQGYDKNYAMGEDVAKKLEAKYPGSKFDNFMICKKAERQVIDAKKAQYRVDYVVECDPEFTDIKKYVCKDANEVRVGDVSIRVTFDATCAKGVNAKSDCKPDNVKMIITKGPGKPTPTPPNKWVPTSKYWLPESVQKAVIKKMLDVTPLKKAGPMRTPDTDAVTIPSYDITRKEDGKGAVAYRVPAFTFTKSLAGEKICPYPFLLQRVMVAVNVDKAGKITFPNNPVKYEKAIMADGTDPEAEERRKCIGQEPWKKAVAKGKKFLKGLPKNQGGS